MTEQAEQARHEQETVEAQKRRPRDLYESNQYIATLEARVQQLHTYLTNERRDHETTLFKLERVAEERDEARQQAEMYKAELEKQLRVGLTATEAEWKTVSSFGLKGDSSIYQKDDGSHMSYSGMAVLVTLKERDLAETRRHLQSRREMYAAQRKQLDEALRQVKQLKALGEDAIWFVSWIEVAMITPREARMNEQAKRWLPKARALLYATPQSREG